MPAGTAADVDVAEIAGLIGEPARAAVLMALIDGRALAASTLAEEATDPILGPGRAHAFHLTESGAAHLAALGVEVKTQSRRPLIRYCIDWSEQRPQLGGALGAGLMEMLLEREWLTRGNGRAILTTPAGEAALLAQFGVDAAALE